MPQLNRICCEVTSGSNCSRHTRTTCCCLRCLGSHQACPEPAAGQLHLSHIPCTARACSLCAHNIWKQLLQTHTHHLLLSTPAAIPVCHLRAWMPAPTRALALCGRWRARFVRCARRTHTPPGCKCMVTQPRISFAWRAWQSMFLSFEPELMAASYRCIRTYVVRTLSLALRTRTYSLCATGRAQANASATGCMHAMARQRVNSQRQATTCIRYMQTGVLALSC